MQSHADSSPRRHAPVRVGSVPRSVRVFSPLLGRLLRAGVPLGPNGLVTVPGRRTGAPRTTPLAIIEADGRRFVWSPFGEVHWVRNLRAAGRATVSAHGQAFDVRARELDAAERLVFFRDVLGGVARSIPFGMAFVRLVDRVDLRDPEGAAARTFVFELTAAS